MSYCARCEERDKDVADLAAEVAWLDEQVGAAQQIARSAINASPVEMAEALRAVVSRLAGVRRSATPQTETDE